MESSVADVPQWTSAPIGIIARTRSRASVPVVTTIASMLWRSSVSARRSMRSADAGAVNSADVVGEVVGTVTGDPRADTSLRTQLYTFQSDWPGTATADRRGVPSVRWGN